MTNRIWKLLGFLLIACLLLSGVSALAETGKVTVHLDILDEHLADKRFTDATGIELEIFKVGEPVGGQLSSWGPTADFSAVSFDDYDTDEKGNKIYTDDQVKQIVADVEAVLEGNPSIPTAKPSLTTEAVNGDVTKVQVVFDELDPGIYYIRKAPSSRPRKMQSTGTLISIPSLGEKNDDVVVVDNQRKPYELNSHIKYTFDPIEQTKFTATKEWVDQDNFDGIQPKEIIVTLWRKLDSDEEPTKVETVTMERPADGGEWEYIWNPIDAEDENGDKYTFSVTEERVPGYDNPIIVDGHIINPHIPDYGCIEVTKKVTVGGNPTTTNLVDGVYAFTITGPTELAKEQRKDNNYFDAFRFDISITGGKEKSWSKTYVMPGTYVVEEIGKVEGGKVVALPTSVEVENAKIEIKVTDRVERDKDGKPVLTDPSDLNSKPKLLDGYDNGTITNNLNAGSLTITKAVTLNGSKTDDVRLNGTYKFTVVGPDNYTKTVEIKVEKGKSTPVTLTDLVPGGYTVTEDSEGLPAGVTIASGSGETYVVNAGADTNATITNDLGIGSIKITKHVTVNGKSTKDTKADGTYTFTVKGPSYPKGHTVTIKITKGAANSVQLDDLLAGAYTVTEETSKLPSKMTLSSTNDLRLNVTGGTVTDASFTNDLGTPTPTPGNHVVVNPTPTPIPNTSINGQKVWNDEKNMHNTRPETITVQLLRDGVVIRETNVTGNSTDERWTYSFTGLPRMNAQGKDSEYTVREQPVTGYTTRIDGLTIFNDLIPQTPKEYTNFNGQKIWDDNDNADGARPNYIIVRLMRDGEEVDRRTVTGANSWQYTFQNMPLDDGYGHTYEYTIREDAVEGYVARIKDFDITNSRLPEVVNPLPDGLDNMVELYDYETPTWGRPLKTGDELPLYPIIFGGIGLTALVALVVLIVIGKKRENHAA